MPTAFSFTAEQIAKISTLRETLAETSNKSAPSGAVALYSYLFKCVTGIDVPNPLPGDFLSQSAISGYLAALPADVRKSALWLYGAIQVNSANGIFSEVIREYNIRQGQLRLGRTFSASELQEASNAVGLNLADSILKSVDIFNNPNPIRGHLPTVQEIGNDDLLGVRNVLYPGNENPGTELYLNQAWPGIVMLGALDGQYTERLLRTDTNQPSVFDTVADFKNLLLCWDSFRYAFKKTVSDFGSTAAMSDMLISMNLAPAFVSSAIAAFQAKGADPFIQLVFSALVERQNPDAKALLSTIATIGSNGTLDMLRRSLNGNGVTSTTDLNFATNALSLFNQFGDTRQYGIASVPGDPTSLTKQSANDFTALVALNAASLFRFTGDTALTTLKSSNASLFAKWQEDQANAQSELLGARNFSDEWQADRAKLIEAMRDGDNAHSDSEYQLCIRNVVEASRSNSYAQEAAWA